MKINIKIGKLLLSRGFKRAIVFRFDSTKKIASYAVEQSAEA